jgi:hypothetical protein
MKGRPIAAGVALLLVLAAPARAQQSPGLAQGDVFGSLGWFNAHKPDVDEYNDWYNRSLDASATFGWYWTEHHKTEVEAAVTTPAELRGYRQLTINGQPTVSLSEFTFSTRRVTASQQYQFGQNAWFHPHVAAGLDFTWERTTQSDEAISIFDPVTRQTRTVRQPTEHPTRHDFDVRPFAATGFKAYMTPRTFFRTDMRFVVGSRLEEVVFRFGFGMDF